MSTAAILPGSALDKSIKAVALVEWGKGLAAIALATGLLGLGPERIQDVLRMLTDRLHIGRVHGPFAWLEQRVEANTLDLVAALCAGYAVLRAIEGWGLWHRRQWAQWLGVVSAAAYLPLDLLALHRHMGAATIALLLLNLGLIALLSFSLVSHRRTLD